MSGFVESPSSNEISALARKKRIPFVEDLGSGAMIATESLGIAEHEPTPGDVLKAGADLVCFSGDKLFGGPQAGIIAGKKRFVTALKREPLFRALRCDKLCLAALQATVDLHLDQKLGEIPALTLLQTSEDALHARAKAIASSLAELPMKIAIGRGKAKAGGGTLPKSNVSSVTIDFIPERSLTGRVRGAPSCVESACDRLYRRRPIQTRSAHNFSWAGRERDQRGSRGVHEVTTRHFIIATAGHVDHGKSALVKALTGTDPDRLPEEKKRQITIDLGFAALNVTAPNGDRIHAGIVDVPGHEDFVRNMIAGVGSIDLALFVVAADDGWMPQSEEHLQILNYLGVQRAVIALTKSDLGRTDVVTNQIREHLIDTPFADSPIVPTSVRTGTGIEKLVNSLATQLARTEPQRDIRKPRLFIDRVFTLRGIGTVVTGTLTGGSLRRGQQIIVFPTNLETRIRSIQSHGHELEVAQPGMRTAINVPDLRVDQIRRGDVVTLPGHGTPTSTLIVRVERAPRPERRQDR